MSVKIGDVVQVHYTLCLDSGDEIDSTYDDEPIEFTVGSDELLPKFESSLVGLSPADKIKVVIEAEEGYGEYDETLTHRLPLSSLELDGEPEVGDLVVGTSEDGEEVPMMIAEIDGEDVILDANHPLAGETLYFEIELVKILPQKTN